MLLDMAWELNRLLPAQPVAQESRDEGDDIQWKAKTNTNVILDTPKKLWCDHRLCDVAGHGIAAVTSLGI